MARKRTPEQFIAELVQHNINNPDYKIELISGQEYINLDTKLDFKCINNHPNFSTAPRYILQKGSGCPICGSQRTGNKNTKGHDEFIKKLEERNRIFPNVIRLKTGERYSGTYTKLIFVCDDGHEFSTLPKTITRGSGCPICKSFKTIETHLYTHEQCLQKLINRNSRSDNKIYVAPGQQYQGFSKKLYFICEHNHTWLARPGDTWNNDTGCPECAGVVKRNTKEAFDEITIKWPLITIIGEYGETVGRREKIQATCEDNHTWDTHYERLMAGHYCPHCHGNAKHTQTSFVNKLNIISPTIEVLGTYERASSHIDVKCTICNHIWKPTPSNLINGYGCPYCSKNNMFSKKAINWLNIIQITTNVKIQHAQNNGEFRIPGTRFQCDGFDPTTNTVYEFYGDYWHGNPQKHNPADYNKHLNKSYGELYNKTISREQTIRDLGYNVVSIWESDYDKQLASGLETLVLSIIDVKDWNVLEITPYHIIIENKNHRIVVSNVSIPPESDDRNKMLKLINSAKHTIILFSDEIEDNPGLIRSKLAHYHQISPSKTVHARKCVIRSIAPKESNALLNKYHVQGGSTSIVAYGAFYNDQLLAIMTFSSPRTGLGKPLALTEGVFELVRFCTDTTYKIPGIASKLLTHFKRNHKWSEIYSYADRRWSFGNMYEKLGFDLVSTNPTAYWYVINGKRKHRWAFRKDILKNTLPNYDPNKTEYENMQAHGFYRVWDCGTLKFVLTNDKP